MKSILATLVMIMAIPALGDDGAVAGLTLRRVGLGEMRLMPDAEGLQVRGRSSYASVSGQSVISAMFFDPGTGSHLTQSDVSSVRSTSANAGLRIVSSASATHGSAGVASLSITTSRGDFAAAYQAAAGGAAVVFPTGPR